MNNNYIKEDEEQEIDSNEIYEIVKNMMPQFENQLREKINDQLKTEYELKLKQQLSIAGQNLQQEISQILQEVQKDTQKSTLDKLQQLLQDEENLLQQQRNLREITTEELEQQEYEEEKIQFMQQVVEDQQLNNPENMLKEELNERLRVQFDEDVRQEVQKVEKQLKIQLRKKIDTEKQQLDEFYQMEWKAKINEQKKELEKNKTELARLKSVCNLKYSKFEEERKKIQQTLEENEKKNQKIIEQLQGQIESVFKENQAILDFQEPKKYDFQKFVTIKPNTNFNSNQKVIAPPQNSMIQQYEETSILQPPSVDQDEQHKEQNYLQNINQQNPDDTFQRINIDNNTQQMEHINQTPFELSLTTRSNYHTLKSEAKKDQLNQQDHIYDQERDHNYDKENSLQDFKLEPGKFSIVDKILQSYKKELQNKYQLQDNYYIMGEFNKQEHEILQPPQ